MKTIPRQVIPDTQPGNTGKGAKVEIGHRRPPRNGNRLVAGHLKDTITAMPRSCQAVPRARRSLLLISRRCFIRASILSAVSSSTWGIWMAFRSAREMFQGNPLRKVAEHGLNAGVLEEGCEHVEVRSALRAEDHEVSGSRSTSPLPADCRRSAPPDQSHSPSPKGAHPQPGRAGDPPPFDPPRRRDVSLAGAR